MRVNQLLEFSFDPYNCWMSEVTNSHAEDVKRDFWIFCLFLSVAVI